MGGRAVPSVSRFLPEGMHSVAAAWVESQCTPHGMAGCAPAQAHTAALQLRQSRELGSIGHGPACLKAVSDDQDRQTKPCSPACSKLESAQMQVRPLQYAVSPVAQKAGSTHLSDPASKLCCVGQRGRQEHHPDGSGQEDDGLLPDHPPLPVLHVVHLIKHHPRHLPQQL